MAVDLHTTIRTDFSSSFQEHTESKEKCDIMTIYLSLDILYQFKPRSVLKRDFLYWIDSVGNSHYSFYLVDVALVEGHELQESVTGILVKKKTFLILEDGVKFNMYMDTINLI
ncbi:hypothetical protein ACJX0J_029080 [Zea mays]